MRHTSVRRRHLLAKIKLRESEVDVLHDTHLDGHDRDRYRGDASPVGWNAVSAWAGEIRLAG